VAWAEAYVRTKWHLDPYSCFATADMAQKLGGCASFGQGEVGSPSNTMWPGPRPTSMPSFIVIHPTVWLQYTNVTDRTGQWSDSIGQTLSQTVAQKLPPPTSIYQLDYSCSYHFKQERGPMPNVMAALSNIGGALCSMPQSLVDARY